MVQSWCRLRGDGGDFSGNEALAGQNSLIAIPRLRYPLGFSASVGTKGLVLKKRNLLPADLEIGLGYSQISFHAYYGGLDGNATDRSYQAQLRYGLSREGKTQGFLALRGSLNRLALEGGGMDLAASSIVDAALAGWGLAPAAGFEYRVSRKLGVDLETGYRILRFTKARTSAGEWGDIENKFSGDGPFAVLSFVTKL